MKPMPEQTGPPEFWMRNVSFAGLLRTLKCLARHPDGLRARDLNAMIVALSLYTTRAATNPAKTTLYHCRNTLLQLGAVKRLQRRLVVNKDDPVVRTLLAAPAPSGQMLSASAREAFACLVLRNPSCKKQFFDLFIPGCHDYKVADFRVKGKSVVWRRTLETFPLRQVVLTSRDGETLRSLRSHSEIRSILYGVRYWARDELRIIDEFYKEGLGTVMYPIATPGDSCEAEDLIRRIVCWPMGKAEEWATISIADLLEKCCESEHRPKACLFEALTLADKRYSGYIMLVPTSRSFATLTARSRQREEHELRSYFRDNQRRYISHIRIHRSLRETSQCLPR